MYMPIFHLIRTLSGGTRPSVSDSQGGDLSDDVRGGETYHAYAVAMSAQIQESVHVIFVGISKIEILPPGDRRILYTDSLQSCFPVIFKFRDGRVALYHGNHTDITPLLLYLNDPALYEVQLFEKGQINNTYKVQGFILELKKHYSARENKPVILHQSVPAHPHDASTIDYSTAVVYQDAQSGQPIVFVAASSATGGMAESLEQNRYQDTLIEPYEFGEVTIEPKIIHAVEEDVERVRKKELPLHYPHQSSSQEQGMHAFAVRAEDFPGISKKYQGQSGWVLKAAILEDFKSRLEGVTNLVALKDLVRDIEKSVEYKVLSTAQGLVTIAACFFGLRKTPAISALNAMVEEQRQNLNARENPRLS
jgi:hypothetical protein